MSIKQNFPAIKPTLLLDFANTRTLDPRITFTRASTATFYDTNSTAKAEQNLLTYSEQFDNAAWAKAFGSVTANTTTAPDGNTTSDTFSEDTSAAVTHRVSESITSVASTTYVLSCYAKNIDRQYITLSINSTASATKWAAAKFDLVGGTMTASNGAGGGTVTSASITSVGNGWYRCVLIGDIGTSTDMLALIGGATDGTTFSASGRGLELYTGTSKSFYLWGAQLEQRSAVTAYTPTTTAAITNYIPTLQTAASGVARFDCNPVTRESLGLLIEEGRTNLLTYSSEFDNAAWGTKDNVVVTANALTAPDGALTADRLAETTASGTHLIGQVLNFTNGVTYTASIYVKAGERMRLRFGASNTTTFAASSFFDLAAGTVISTTFGTASIASVGNGWYRLSITGVSGQTAITNLTVSLVSTGTTVSYTGDGYSGIFIWGAQLEAGAFATSYIPTVAAQVTRAADAASMTGENFSSWYSQGQGALFVEVQSFGAPSTHALRIGLSQSDYALAMNNLATPFAAASTRYKGGTTYSATSATVLALGVPFKSCASYGQGQVSISANGGTVVSTNTPDSFSSAADLRFSPLVSSSTTVGGAACYRKVAYYPIRVTNAQLQGLTTV